MIKNLDIQPEDIDPNDPTVVDKIISEIEKERDDLLRYREQMKRWKTFNKNLRVDNLDYITSELLEFYNPNTRQFEPPKHRWNGKKPVIGICADDIQSTPLIGSKKFNNLCIKMRHIGAFEDGEPPIGCSIFICVQNYTCQGNQSISKAIRGNINCCAIWKTATRKNWPVKHRVIRNHTESGILQAYVCDEQGTKQQTQLSLLGSHTETKSPKSLQDELHHVALTVESL